MPLRYNKTLRDIFKEMLHMQRIGLLDAATDESLREYLHTHRKAFRELHRLAEKRQKRWAPPELTKAWAEHFSSTQYSVEATVTAVLSDLKQVRVKTADGLSTR